MINSTSLVTFFPEFSTVSTSILDNFINRAYLKSNGFDGICSRDRQDYAVALLTAHLYSLSKRINDDPNQGRVKKLKSRNDEIEFIAGQAPDFGLNQTIYGHELAELLTLDYSGGFLV